MFQWTVQGVNTSLFWEHLSVSREDSWFVSEQKQKQEAFLASHHLSEQRVHSPVTACMTTPELRLISSLKQILNYNLELRFQNQSATVGQPAFKAFDFLWLSE